MKKIAIIGAGKVGTALGYLLQKKGYPLVGVTAKHWERAEEAGEFLGTAAFSSNLELLSKAECFFLTTPDGHLQSLAQELAPAAKKGDYFFHCSGALPAEVLQPLKEKGAYIFSLHPLQTFASVETALNNLPGSFFAAQGDKEVLPWVERIVADLGGELFFITQEEKALYHAGACVACNYLVALLDMAALLYQRIGIPKDKALQALMPLVKGTVSNLESLGTPEALTGPIARGDSVTISEHLKSFNQKAPELKELYIALGLYTLQVGLAKGTLKEEKAKAIKNIFQEGMIENG